MPRFYAPGCGTGSAAPWVTRSERAGVEDPHARAHSPNESLHVDTFRHAVLSEALLLETLDRRTADA